VFEASGDCSKVVWQWLGWSMPQWLVGIFSAMLVIWGLVVIAQFIGRPPRRIFS
jgi:disulfide bond formation protein DsbB